MIDVYCPHCGVSDEQFKKRTELDEIVCKNCGKDAERIPSAPKVDWDALAMGRNASPEAIRHWERKQRDRKAKEKKAYANNGDYGPAAGAD